MFKSAVAVASDVDFVTLSQTPCPINLEVSIGAFFDLTYPQFFLSKITKNI